MKVYNGLDGSLLKALPLPRTIRVSRRKLRTLCSQGIDVKVCENQEMCNAVSVNSSNWSIRLHVPPNRSNSRQLANYALIRSITDSVILMKLNWSIHGVVIIQ